jgi:Peptidase family M13
MSDKNPIPADKSSWGTFGVLADANRERIRTILEAAASDSNARPATDQRKMGDLYASCLDTAAIDARGRLQLCVRRPKIGATLQQLTPRANFGIWAGPETIFVVNDNGGRCFDFAKLDQSETWVTREAAKRSVRGKVSPTVVRHDKCYGTSVSWLTLCPLG